MDHRTRDARQLKRAAAGERGACRALVDANLKPMLGLAYRILGNAAEAEDVAQEAFLRLWRAAPSWRPDARVKVWLYRVVRNLSIDRLRRSRRFTGEAPPEMAVQASQLHTLQNGQVAAFVESALRGLPERQRIAITLVHLQEETSADAAAVLGVSPRALEQLLARGRAGLRKALKKHKLNLLGE
jgi:RNA polymerase sigma-70 factor, ECF subfamily